MKILFVTYNYFPDEDANTNVTYSFIKEIAKTHSVEIFAIHKGKAPQCIGFHNGLKVYYSNNGISLLEHIYIKLHQKMIYTSAENFLFFLIKKYILRLLPLKSILKRRKSCISEILEIINSNKYDVIISASAPIETHLLVNAVRKETLKKKIKWFQLVEDPHSEYIGFKEQRESLKRMESEFYKNADKIFAFKQIADNKNDVLNDFSDKLVKINYPNFCVKNFTAKNFNLDKAKIQFLYLGSLQDLSVRNPEYLYRIIEKSQSMNYHFNFVVNNWDEENISLKKRYLDTLKNVTFYNTMSIEDCFSFMGEADYLVNISNLVLNQVPSKVFDYIGMGKPIVNFYKNDNDPALEFLNKYPLCINIDEKKSVEENELLLREYSVKYKDKKVDEEVLNKLYKENTPDEAVKPILKELCGR